MLCEYGCGKEAKHQFKNGKWCCSKNQLQCKKVKESKERTILKKYGVDNPSKILEIKEKKKKTYLSHYGVDNPSKSDQVKEVFRKTCLKKYGVDHPSKCKKVKEKRKETCIKKYGVDNPSKSEKVKEKRKETFIKKYSSDFYVNSVEAKMQYLNKHKFFIKLKKLKLKIMSLKYIAKTITVKIQKKREGGLLQVEFKWQKE